MPKVMPWSYSGLDTFRTCPRKFEAEKITKSVPYTEGEAQRYGTAVHLAFEQHVRDGTDLPAHLVIHKPLMEQLAEECDLVGVERDVGLTRQLKPCRFFDKEVWWRGKIDYHGLVRGTQRKRARVVDYKTGKQHSKMDQLILFAFYCFCEDPELQEVEVMYYWTQSKQSLPRIIYPRQQMSRMLGSFAGDLRQYLEAFQTGIWQPRQNGLCRAWCGVLNCEYNGGGSKVI